MSVQQQVKGKRAAAGGTCEIELNVTYPVRGKRHAGARMQTESDYISKGEEGKQKHVKEKHVVPLSLTENILIHWNGGEGRSKILGIISDYLES